MIRPWKRWGIAILAFFTAGFIVACQNISSPVREVDRPTNCNPVEHIAGTTCVPDSFERLVSLDTVTFEDAIALGVKPIATVLSDHAPHLSDQISGVEDIGRSGTPALENIVATSPDLIVGLDFHQMIYSQTAQIAPTVLLKFEHSGHWKEFFQSVAQTLGREETAQHVMDAYNQRVGELQAKLGDRHPIVSVVRLYPDSINLYLRDSFAGTVLQDVGLARPEAQDLTATEGQQIANNPIQQVISRELLSQIDGDVLFVWTAEDQPEANQKAREHLAKLQTDPLWKKLNVVQNNQVYSVPSYWIGSGPIAANAILDDLSKYLIEAPQS